MSPTNKLAIFASLTFLVSLTGCASINDGHYERTQKFRTMKAWYHYSWNCEESFSSDYKNGWKAGYYDVLTGNCGKAPLIAPKKYWCPSQITKNCDLKRYEWYIGFHDGANCARTTPDTHYLKPWIPEYCEPESHGTMLDSSMLEPLPGSMGTQPTTDLSAPPLPELPASQP